MCPRPRVRNCQEIAAINHAMCRAGAHSDGRDDGTRTRGLCRDSGCFRSNGLKSNGADRRAQSNAQEVPLHPNCTQIPHRFSVNSLTSRAAAFLAHLRLHFAIHVVMTSKCSHASFDTASRRSDFQNSKHCTPTFSRVLRSDRTAFRLLSLKPERK